MAGVEAQMIDLGESLTANGRRTPYYFTGCDDDPHCALCAVNDLLILSPWKRCYDWLELLIAAGCEARERWSI